MSAAGAAIISPTPQRPLAVTLSADDTTTEEPPDMNSLRINGYAPATAQKIASSKQDSNVVDLLTPPASSSPVYATTTLASSLDSTFRRAYADRKNSPIIPQSPSVAESNAGSISDYDNEHEPDSPSSLSSWNSWAGGRRGDLADVEDLELDGITALEPELETVSELDEESSAFMSGSDRPIGESEDEQSRTGSRQTNGAGSEHSSRRRHLNHGVPHPHHPHYQHHASHLHPHGVPVHPHFSPRAGGHGLSHASRHLLRAPPNLAARRRKGRLAELAEEVVGSISTTKMPQEYEKVERSSPSPNDQTTSLPTSLAVPNGTGVSASVESPSSSGGAGSPLDNGLQSNFELEIFGPPALPVRSVSPSETVPTIPSPLCVCLTADEQGEVTEINHDITPTREVAEAEARNPRQHIDASTPVPPSPTTSGRSTDTHPATASTPPTSPPTSPQLGRKGSLRSRRASSPGRTKPKLPLRPCFKRRSTEKSIEPALTPDSASDHGRSSPRGRTKVRFSQAPPIEVRTHSPVEYDRKACPVSNRLSAEDLEELRLMKMEMGLLEAKCAALAACKPETSLRGSHSFTVGPADPASSDSESESHLSGAHYLSDQRRRADSISSSSPTTSCGARFLKRADSKSRITPAEYLRMEREKERERVCRMAGIGTGVGFRYTGNPNTRQMPHGGCETFGASSIISRFGLSKPPPPLPGMCAPSNSATSVHSGSNDSPQAYDLPIDGYNGGASLYRPNSAPPVRGPTDSNGSSASAFPQARADSAMQHHHELEGISEEPQRGRQMEKGLGGRLANPSSTSTDATLTEADVNAMRAHVPTVTRTRASVSPMSSSGYLQDRTRSLSPNVTRLPYQADRPSSLHQYSPTQKPTRPGIYPVINAQSSPSYELLPTPNSINGYDSPASEFCYESGSEYDLCG